MWISGGWAKQNQVRSHQRPFSSNELAFVNNTAGVLTTSGVLNQIAVRAGPFFWQRGTLVAPGKLTIFSNGGAYNTTQPTLDGNSNGSGATDYDNQFASRYLRLPYSRLYLASEMNFEVAENSSAEFEINYTKTHAYTAAEPAPNLVQQDIYRVPRGGVTELGPQTLRSTFRAAAAFTRNLGGNLSRNWRCRWPSG